MVIRITAAAVLLAVLLNLPGTCRSFYGGGRPLNARPNYSYYTANSGLRTVTSRFTEEEATAAMLTSSVASPSPFQSVLDEYSEEIRRIRGTPELVDRLENLARTYPGIERDIRLYRLIYPFKLDSFQEDGLQALMMGNNALIATPTGSGKTVVGELAIYYALMLGLRVAYTTPLKALSNQKFQDFTAKYGGDRVALLTGDIAINRGAPVTVMTTEVFRNMIYDQGSDQLDNLFMVCFDEFHFMNDPDRGTVWEESVISCPPKVRILALSATMGNVKDIQGWISSIHGPTDLVISDHRPVPLRYFFGMKQGLLPLFRDPNAGPGALSGVQKAQGKLGAGATINPSILKFEEQAIKNAQQKMQRNGKPMKMARVNTQSLIPKYSDIVENLAGLNLLPVIIFIFSRTGCEQNAKMLLQSKLRLLNDEEVRYVTAKINNFIKQNPEIPFSKSDVQMLRAGVGVHHAGLIPVLKAFVEDLFNANKIKVLFATETLAAGVNMPARTTVISTVTKRVNSEVVKLKTSQMLQMAGRAGRRGKDEEGTVVVMRNRFEDVGVGHRILTSAIDGIKSHFKTSYGLTVTLLETKSIDECRALIERGFGAYLLQQRVQRKVGGDEKEDVELFRAALQKFTLKGARDYLKVARRLEKELRNNEFLLDKMAETDSDLVQAIADYMPLGVGLQLQSGQGGFFLGDVKWGSGSGFGVIAQDLSLLVVKKEHIRAFADAEFSIRSKDAQDLLEVVSYVKTWEDVTMAGAKKAVMRGEYSTSVIPDNTKILAALETVKATLPFPVAQLPGSVVRQRMIIEELEAELAASPVTQAGEEELVLQALRYAAGLKDPLGFVSSTGEGAEGKTEIYAWRMFQSVMKILQTFNALEGTKATELGDMVSSLTGDNELWLAMVLRHEGLTALTPAQLGAVISSVVVDGFKMQNAYFKNRPSEGVFATCTDLDKLSWGLKLVQAETGVDFPVFLSREAGGLVESWASGVSWRDLCKETSLEQGDVCRLLRRTVETLRQIPLAYGVEPAVVQLAVKAAELMDRFPVADMDSSVAAGGDRSSASSGVGFGVVGDAEDIDYVDEILSKESTEEQLGAALGRRWLDADRGEVGALDDLDRLLEGIVKGAEDELE